MLTSKIRDVLYGYIFISICNDLNFQWKHLDITMINLFMLGSQYKPDLNLRSLIWYLKSKQDPIWHGRYR